jgi:hypothetical protein
MCRKPERALIRIVESRVRDELLEALIRVAELIAGKFKDQN